MDFAPAFSLAGHRALITGGGSGLGLATARCFVAAGAEVVLVGRDAAKLAAAADLGPSAASLAFDVADAEGAEAFAAEAEVGPISILVNNAATPARSRSRRWRSPSSAPSSTCTSSAPSP
jgi:gluconate 5-dehydrogenase